MSVIREACDVCGSSDNRAVFENGSTWCFTMDCAYNKERKQGTKEEINGDLHEGVYEPLPNRRISQRTCEFFSYQVAFINNQTVHIANYKDSTGKIVAQKLRYPNKEFPWVGEPKKATLFGKHLWSNKSKNIIITEGEIDAMSIAEAQDCKWPVVSIPHGAQSAVKTITAELEWLSGFEQIVLCFDRDDAGQRATEQVAALFAPGKVRIANLSNKDANEVLVAGKIKELTAIVWNATEYRPDGIVTGREIDLTTLFTKEDRGLSSPYPMLDEMIRGWLPGRLYTFYAGTGNGKTSIMKECLRHLRIHHPEQVIANFFLEENLKHTVKSLLALESNIPTFKLNENPELLSDEVRKTSYDKLIYNGKDDKMLFYRHFGSLDSKRLFNMLEYFVIGKGAKIVFLDHISILISGLEDQGEGERRAIDKIMTDLRAFAERTQVTFIIATQLKRQEKAYGEGADITESSARGSGSIEHLSDVIISLNRNKSSDSPNEVLLKVVKNRISGFIGEADLIEYNLETGRYLPKKKQIKVPEKYKKLVESDNDDVMGDMI
jgi:twinkle protein